MIDITTLTGELYSFDPETERIFKDGKLLSPVSVEPVYSSIDTVRPRFSGIHLKDTNSILSLSGKINPITDENAIS